uniref:Uncharacterized protein n=1 Tax=Rhizophora mucronata TaxID=61149 RepID=A0A2P2QFE5_RHIMU
MDMFELSYILLLLNCGYIHNLILINSMPVLCHRVKYKMVH